MTIQGLARRAFGGSALILVAVLFVGFLGWLARPAASQAGRNGEPAPDIAGGPWINSAPLTLPALKGRVVLVEFWTYG